jgi:hypothetical protein
LCIGWTWNLHGNWGYPAFFDRHELQRFANELDQRVDGRVELATIDWIWDQYANHTRGGQRYADGCRQAIEDTLKEVDSNSWPGDPLEEWIEMYETEKSKAKR